MAIYITNYCLSIKMNDTFIYDKTCINFENIMLSKGRQKNTHHHVIHNSTQRKSLEQANWYREKVDQQLLGTIK